MAGTFLTALNCIQAHQLFDDDADEDDDDDVEDDVEAGAESTRGLERIRWARQPTGDANKEDANDEAKPLERPFQDPVRKCIIYFKPAAK